MQNTWKKWSRQNFIHKTRRENSLVKPKQTQTHTFHKTNIGELTVEYKTDQNQNITEAWMTQQI